MQKEFKLINVDFNPINEEFIVCSAVDLRYISIFSGEQTKILTGLSGSNQDIT
jgi:hypothetical protein